MSIRVDPLMTPKETVKTEKLSPSIGRVFMPDLSGENQDDGIIALRYDHRALVSE
jgi:hypothetical protein